MSNLFLFIIFASIVCFFIGLISLILNLMKNKNKKTSIIITISSIIVFIVSVTGFEKTYNAGTDDSDNNYYETTYDPSVDKASTVQSDSEKGSLESNNSENPTVESSESSSINSKISDLLEQNKGFANGTLDENGNYTENGTPNPSFNWALTIDKITYENNLLKVIVNDNFLSLNKTEADAVSLSAQNAAVSIISEDKNWDMKKAGSGLYTQVYYNDNVIGHSKMTNVKEFKWQ
ncbi:hypothetical protein ACQUJC_000545 [Enterococcus faecium]|uniref:hypothetical protein n=1 Tax=Enterococcus faecium TaxID=1352 RepID=UPI00136CBC9E|nr:hypothetical protein [Enterococcus faecium]EMF0557115.1 hypothetical protein [Enterococcus faecium]NAL97757.1 hypothetical protein [Enterococcus faecium]NAM11475.1 hypothetical protein [Enterococcus faecium]NAM26654.1 hypothetical protein [Enterococcus faecium]NAM34708.1 hypothetical protein [Enterococcus faecium]